MKHILLLLLSFFAPVVWGQQVEQFKLWPDKPEAGEAEIFVYHPAKGGKAAAISPKPPVPRTIQIWVRARIPARMPVSITLPVTKLP